MINFLMFSAIALLEASISSPVLQSSALPIAKPIEETSEKRSEKLAVSLKSESAIAAQGRDDDEPVRPEELLDLDPEIVEDSPVLQRWLEEVPDVRSEIVNDPAFRTRVRVGYVQDPETDRSGVRVGVEDIFLGARLTLSGDYQNLDEQHQYGADLRYYVLPLGSQINLAPIVGYRHLETDAYEASGINLGLRLLLALSRTGAADLSVSQSWVSPGGSEEVGITTLTAGYALTDDLRFSTDFQIQTNSLATDRQFGVGIELMF